MRLLGFLNDTLAVGDRVGNYSVLGRFEDWSRMPPETKFIAAFPFATAMKERHARLRSLDIPDDRWESIVHPEGHLAARARIGIGCYVAAGVIVEHGANVGRQSILRAGAYVSHDVHVGEFGFVGPNATLLGRSVFGQGVHVGANAVCRDDIQVGDYALIGIGSVVVDDVEPGAIVAGNPARSFALERG